jgi:glutamine synthetase
MNHNIDAAKVAAVQFVDNAGVARVKCVPAPRLMSLSKNGIGVSPVFGVLTTDDTPGAVPGWDSCQGDLRLRPDLEALYTLPTRPGWLWAPADQYTQEGQEWAGCQRGFLRRMVTDAHIMGLSFLSAFELEWTAGRKQNGSWIPLHEGPSHGGVLMPKLQHHFEGIFDDLTAAGIEADHTHVEYGAGQLEAAMSPAEPVAACDEAVLARMIVHGRSVTDGWEASFAPVVMEPIGNGAHTHISVWRDGRNLFAPNANGTVMDDTGRSFIAGILRELPALTAIGSPLRISYSRLQPGKWSGGWACWGVENREAALRLEGSLGPNANNTANLEWKSVDGAANPYLAMGAMIAAGLQGIRDELELPDPVNGDPAKLPTQERERVAPQLPHDIDVATAALRDNTTLRRAMGDLLLDSIAETRRLEAKTTEDLSAEEQIARSLGRY